jgi:hypothetical protein
MGQPRSLLGIDQTAVLGLQFHGLSRWGQLNIERLAPEHDCFSGDQIHLSVAKAPIKLHGIIHNYIFPPIRVGNVGVGYHPIIVIYTLAHSSVGNRCFYSSRLILARRHRCSC